MSAYYNENDKFAAAWLRELIKAKLIVDGEVDERSIREVTIDDIRGFTQCHFFAGIGGWSLALRLAGWPDSRHVWTGSCPCQPWSQKGRGARANDPRDLWPTWFKLIEQCQPPSVFGEQVASADGLAWLDRVYADMERADYAIGAANLSADAIGANHERQRLWFVADSSMQPRLDKSHSEENPQRLRDYEATWRAGAWDASTPAIHRISDGIPNRVGIYNGFGNAIVPQVAQVFIEAYMNIAEAPLVADCAVDPAVQAARHGYA